MGNLFSEIFLSLKINWVRPCLTAISDSFLILSIEASRFSLLSKVQSIFIDFSPKKLVNFSNWEFDNIGLSKTYMFSSVKLVKSKIFQDYQNEFLNS